MEAPIAALPAVLIISAVVALIEEKLGIYLIILKKKIQN